VAIAAVLMVSGGIPAELRSPQVRVPDYEFPEAATRAIARGLVHKTDAGGVHLGLDGADAVRAAAADIGQRVVRAGYELDGFVVQPMPRTESSCSLAWSTSTASARWPRVRRAGCRRS
jgi:ATP-grasp domain